jgi:mannose-6-phosphate isomerase-like protein (cupin superfamily)
MKVTKVEDGFVAMSDGSFTGRRLYDSPQATLIHMAIRPGKAIESHAASVDMEFFVLEGRGLFIVGDESAEAGPGALVESPKDVPHGIRNVGPGELLVLAIKNGKSS